ncbi:MAG: DUF84 family protein [Promethearchaeia archaeon]
MEKVHISVRSQNPTKIKGTKRAFLKYFKQISLFHIDANSGVGDQPIGMEKIIKGAKNRAVHAYSTRSG